MADLTHFDKEGKAVMVDVGDKAETERAAIAMGRVLMNAETLKKIQEGSFKKGDILGVARIAGIMGAKKTSELIPLCHPLSLSSVTIDFECDEKENSVEITATCKLKGKTGVEMEALTAVQVALLTVYDMCKAVDRGMVMKDIGLLSKSGGKSGTWKRSA